jgi:hypothetical protein
MKKIKTKALCMFALLSIANAASSQAIENTGNIFRYPALSVNDVNLFPAEMLNASSWIVVENFISTPVLGTPFDYTAWTPSLEGNVVDFTQSRSYTVTESYYWQAQQENDLTGQRRVVGEKNYVNTDSEVMESRNVIVTNELQVIGESYGCSSYTPSSSDISETVEFEQTRECEQDEASVYTYSTEGSEVLGTWQGELSTQTVEESRMTRGTREKNIIFDLGRVYVDENNPVTRRFSVGDAFEPDNYTEVRLILNYEHTYPEDVAFTLIDPEALYGYAYFKHEKTNDLGARYYSNPSSFGWFISDMNGEWTVLVEDFYENDGGFIDVRFELIYNETPDVEPK